MERTTKIFLLLKVRFWARLRTKMWCVWPLGFFMCMPGLAGAQDYTIAKLKLFADREEVLIRDVTMDSLGFIWYLASGEIYRYDGYRSLNILPTIADQRLTNDMPQRILIDKKNRLWMAGNVHLSYLDLKTWKVREVDSSQLPPIHDRMIGSINLLTDTTLLFMYESGQLLLLEGDEFIQIEELHKQGLAAHTKVIPQSAVWWDGKYWVGTSAGTLLSIDPTQDHQVQYHQLPGINTSVLNMITHEDGLILNVFPDKLHLYGNNGEVAPYSSDGVDLSEADFYMLREGGPFHIYADSKWAYLLDRDLSVTQRIAMPLLNEFGPKHIHMNGDEVILGTEEGIVVIYPQTKGLSQVIPPNKSNNKSVRGIYVYPDGAYFYSTYQGAGFVESDGSVWPLEKLRHAYVVYPISPDQLFVGTEGGFIKVFDRRTRQLTDVTYTLRPEPNTQQITDLPLHVMSLAETDSDYLIGSATGLWLLDKKNFGLRRAADIAGVPYSLGLQIRHILPTNTGSQLLSTNMGLFEWQNGAWIKRYPAESNVGVFKTVAVGDTWWIATQGKGLVAMDTQNQILETITTEDGLSNNLVYSLEYADGIFVAGTADGLNLIRDGQIRRISMAEGLSQSEFNSSASFWDAVNRKMYFGGLKGYTVLDMTERWFDPADKLESYVTEVHTSSSKHGRRQADYTWPYRKEQKLTLEAGESLAGLFMGLPGNYRVEGEIKYALDAGDREALKSGQFISLLEPSPGEYRLKVETSNKGMVVHQKELIISKQPYFYQTWWFQGLLFGWALLVLFAWYRSRIMKIRDEQAIRNRIAADLHDEVGSLLTRIYFQVNVIASRQPSDEKTRTQLDLISGTSQQALATMSDMVWSIESRFDTMKDLVIRMKDYVYSLREEVAFNYKFEERGEMGPGKVSQEVRQNLFLIFKEALTNAIKYANGSEIHIVLEMDPVIRLTVINEHPQTGHGVGDQQGGRGLVIMKHRVGKVGGNMMVSDTHGYFKLQVDIPPKRGIYRIKKDT